MKLRIFYITCANLELRRAHTNNIRETVRALTSSGKAEATIVSKNLWRTLYEKRQFYDVVYFRDHKLFFHAFAAKIMLGKVVVHEVHSTHSLPLLRYMSVQIADGVIFITNKLKDYYDPKGRKLSLVVHCSGVRMEDFAIMESKEDIRKALHLPHPAYIAMYVGSTQWYDIKLLVAMLTRLPEDTFLVLVGVKEDEWESLRSYAKDIGVYDKIISLGRVPHEDIPRYLLAADVLVNPLRVSFPGSISSKIYEYFAAGRPIVSSRGGANDEILRDGLNSILADLTPRAFAEAVMRLRSDDDFRKSISEQAEKDATIYTWEARAEEIFKLITEALNRKKKDHADPL